MSVKNNLKPLILTFDLEYWFESTSILPYVVDKPIDSLEIFITQILKILNEARASATFFVSAKVLECEPGLIKKMNEVGQEIGVHAYDDHLPLGQKTVSQFERELKEMLTKFEKVLGFKPISYRAPSFSLNSSTSWVLEILVKNNFKYDSSIFPHQFNFLLRQFYKQSSYGVKSKQYTPYPINLKDPLKVDNSSSLFEFPISVFHFWFLKVPLTGGIYIRFIPWILYKKLLKIKLKNEPACLHFHPFDFLEQAPAIKMPRFKKFIKYYNTKNTWKKLVYLLNKYECISIERYLKSNKNDILVL